MTYGVAAVVKMLHYYLLSPPIYLPYCTFPSFQSFISRLEVIFVRIQGTALEIVTGKGLLAKLSACSKRKKEGTTVSRVEVEDHSNLISEL
jgi:hypothetical protein